MSQTYVAFLCKLCWELLDEMVVANRAPKEIERNQRFDRAVVLFTGNGEALTGGPANRTVVSR